MAEDRLYRLFGTLDSSLDPGPEFSEDLFESLSVDLGFRRVNRRAVVADRIRSALGRDRLPAGSVALRLAYLGAIVGLLFVAGLVLIAVGALLRERSASDIVSQSIARYEAPPPFVMTARLPDGSVNRFLSDGSGSVRIESVTGRLLGELPVGSYLVRTDAGQAIFGADDRSWQVSDQPIAYPLAGLPLDWVPPVAVTAGATPPTYVCPNWHREPDDTIAGRGVFHVACGELAFWIDKESLLILRRDDPDQGASAEVMALSLEPPASTLFSLERPVGAVDADDPRASTVLSVGDLAPDWSGTLLDGGSFDTSSLRGKPAVLYFWADWCEPCVGAELDAFAAQSRARGDDAAYVAVSWHPTSKDVTRRLIESTGGGFRTVVDADGAISAGWGLAGAPALVLIDADGRVRSVTVGAVTDADLARMVDALVSGAPVPTPEPVPTTLPAAPVGSGQPIPRRRRPACGRRTHRSSAQAWIPPRVASNVPARGVPAEPRVSSVRTGASRRLADEGGSR